MPQKYNNVSEVPLALGVFLASDNYDYNNDPYTISATSLLKPVRQLILSSRVPPGEALPDLANMMSSRMGAAIHDGIERAWLNNYRPAMESLGYPKSVIDKIVINPTSDQLSSDQIPIYLEQRLSKTIGKWTVTGKFDFIGQGRVQDYKSTSVFTYKNQVNANKYCLQESIYRWLSPEIITEDEGDIHYIFTDWKSNMAKSDPTYPTKRFLTQTFKLKPIHEIDAYIKNKLYLIEKYSEAAEADIPECDEEDLWRSDPQFKYYKNGDTSSKRSTKNFQSRQEALIYKATNGNVGAIKEVPGQVVACKYCPAFAACTQKDRLIASGDLLMD